MNDADRRRTADKLTMRHFLETMRAHGIDTPERLMDEGHHYAVINAKAEKASRKGYTDYGVTPARGWLTRDGIRKLEETK